MIRCYRTCNSFSALQRAENSSIRVSRSTDCAFGTFQCSSASRKFLNPPLDRGTAGAAASVSVLFSEPKIPQSMFHPSRECPRRRFSALQRAENSSIKSVSLLALRRVLRFSALQRAENSSIPAVADGASGRRRSFSALQRAENSSMGCGSVENIECTSFQCSSASRKFLNCRQGSPNAHRAR